MKKGIKEKSGISAKWNFVLRDKYTKKIISEETIKNLIVNDGLERTARRLGSVVDYFTSIAIGTGTDAATNADVELQTEYTRADATTTEYVADYKWRWIKTFTFGSGVSEDITEAGLLDSDVVSGSTLFNRVVTSAKTVTADNELVVTVTVTIARV